MMRMPRTLALVVVAVFLSSAARAAIVTVVEYYDAALDHYFVTANPTEIAALDGGQFPGWVRTGLGFSVYATGSGVAGSTPVCRFYGSPAAGLDSHFFSASPLECQEVLQRYPVAWLLESSDVFEVFLPDLTTGACPAGSIPIYRAWNQRVDSNHRYTTDLSVLEAMIAKGYVAEGYGAGPTPTAMCSPASGGVGAGVPACIPTASNTFPYVGTSVTLFANCNGNPTSYVWTGCSSTGGRCTATSSVAGMLSYTVVASNASGTSVPSSINVSWQSLPPPPMCNMIVTTNTVPPVVGSLALLDAACSNAPTSYAWTSCASGTGICNAYSNTTGVQTYSVAATNAGGTSPVSSASVDWLSMPPTPPGLCSAFPSYLFTDDGWTSTRLITSEFTDPPGFASDGVWVVKLTVPPGAASARLGSFSAAEYNGPPTLRQMTLSTVPCDFRSVDPTGSNGPLAESDSARILFALGGSTGGVPGLAPGETYYVNVRNWSDLTNSVSCLQSRCDAFMDISLP